MARDDMGAKLKSAIQQTLQENVQSVVDGGLTRCDGELCSFSIVVQPVQNEDEGLLLICFIDEPKREQDRHPPATAPEDVLRVTMLEQELESTNEELAASKGELQSLNEELIALNSQLQETLEWRRVAASLRQPLQALALLQGLLAETVQGEKERKLVAKLGETLDGMSAIPDTELEAVLSQSGTALPILQPAPRSRAPSPVPAASSQEEPVIFVVDDDSQVREAISAALEEHGRSVEAYSTCEAFLEAYRPEQEACLLIDAYLPGMSGLELLQRLHDDGHQLPAIMITGASDVAIAVQAMKAGALDFIEKPITLGDLLASVERALEQSRDSHKLLVWRETATNRVASLTPRERQIMEMVLAGHPSKNIAADLFISQRTVENHRASIMKKTGSKSLPALARLALAAAADGSVGELIVV
jgi:FixJ family two-component response regulator